MYITYEEYTQLYEPIDEMVFNRLCFDACRVLDIHTTGIDNVRKLKIFPPVDEDAVQAVKHCAAKLVNLLDQIREAEVAAYGADENGIRGRVVSSVTSGNESISYATAPTAVMEAVKNPTMKEKLMADTVWEYLAGVPDANGVGLLFMGMYPRRYLC